MSGRASKEVKTDDLKALRVYCELEGVETEDFPNAELESDL